MSETMRKEYESLYLQIVVGLVPRLALGSDQKYSIPVDKFKCHVKCRRNSHAQLCGLLCKLCIQRKHSLIQLYV